MAFGLSKLYNVQAFTKTNTKVTPKNDKQINIPLKVQ